AVKNVTIDAGAENLVAQCFDGVRIIQPATVGTGSGSKRLRTDHGASINVTHRSSELDGGVDIISADPKFAHRDVRRRALLQRFIRSGVRLDGRSHAVRVAKFLEMPIVVFRE